MPRKEISRYVEDPLIRSMRVRAWFQAVTKTSGLTTHELEREFGTGEGNPRSCIWNKYRRGEVVPRSVQNGDGSPKLVERVEERYPGTSKWLFSPVWRLIDKAAMDMKDIRQIYNMLPVNLRAIFICKTEKHSVFWRSEVPPKEALKLLKKIGGLECLLGVLAMLREAEVAQNRTQYAIAVEGLSYVLASRVIRNLEWPISECVLLNFINSYREWGA